MADSLHQNNIPSNPQNEKEKEDDLIIKSLRPDDRIFLPIEELDSPYKDLILSLPQEKRLLGIPLRQYKGFWQGEGALSGIISFQNSFKPRPDDIFVASFPKCGTTWLKAITFAIINRNRDPKDALISMWHMINMGSIAKDQTFSLSQAFELFCEGRVLAGPIWEHMLEYWNESLKKPQKILFLKYEDLLENPLGWVKKIADFLGYSFSREEEMDGVPKKIVDLCNFKSLTSLDVNKKEDGITNVTKMNHIYFRKGVKGDWRNNMSLEMAERMDAITKEKLGGSGLSFSSSVMKTTSDST
ncbi:hypothetical protein LUZ60_005849 [Juncus effusus]|nr:hypothetical protein LUZ60_005849 [Juncus effusus]